LPRTSRKSENPAADGGVVLRVTNELWVPAGEELEKALTLPNPAYAEAKKYERYLKKIPETLKYYEERKAGIAVPRGFTCEAIRLTGDTKIEDLRRSLPEIEFTFKGSLRPYQERAVKDASRRDFGVLESPTGSGKTTMALWLVAARKQPVLIVVHNKELLYQWRDRIAQFLGEEAGLIGDGHYEIRNITVAIVNSAKKHLEELPERFGHLIIDECHRCPSKTFTSVVAAFDCKYMLGLSATPYRRDGLGKVINFYLGPTVHTVDKRELEDSGSVLKPEIRQVETDFFYDYQDDYQAMLTTLVEDEDRNQLIASETLKALDRGTVLVVSDRVSHCEELERLLGSVSPALLTGQTPKAERTKIVEEVQQGQVKVLIATIQLIGEGFDCSGLTTLVLATPIRAQARVVQTVGRILRPAEGKQPLVIDIVDGQVGVLRASARHRKNFLR